MPYQYRRRSGRGLKNQLIPRPLQHALGYTTAGTLSNPQFRQAVQTVADRLRQEARNSKSFTQYERKLGMPSFKNSTDVVPRKPRKVGRRRVRYARTLNQADMLTPITLNFSLGNSKRIDSRILKTAYVKRIQRWQRLNVLNAGGTLPGSLALHHSVIETNKTLCPCFIMCLNHTNNDASLTAGPLYSIKFNDTGGLELQTNTPTEPDGTASTSQKWITDTANREAGAASLLDPDTRYIMQAYYDIRMNCYGANAQPTIYDIMVVSFTDDYLDPMETPSNAQEVADRHKTWQSLVQPYMANPLLPKAYVKKKYIVHKRVRFTLQPTLNTENDITPQSKMVKMFIKDGKFYDYAYHGDGFTGAGADDKLSTTQYTVQNTAGTDYADFPQPRARKWLIVRALNTTRVAIGSHTAANTPSFDLIVRKAEYFQSGSV